MPTLPMYLLLGSIAWSALSVVGLAAFLVWHQDTDGPTAAQSMNVSALVRGVEDLSPVSLPLKSEENTAASIKMPSESRFSQSVERAQKPDLKKVGDPPVNPAQVDGKIASDAPLDYMVFGDEIIVLLDTARLDERAQQRVLVRLMLLPELKSVEQLLDTKGIALLRLPNFYGRILWQGKPVRYPLQAQQMARALLARARPVQELGHTWREVHIPLKEVAYHDRAVRWHDLIVRESRRNRLDVALVSAIVETESGYRPHVKSRSGAVGLMQVMPKQAAQDVMKQLGKRLDERALLNPETNVAAGSAYLALLKHHYLAGVKNPRSREYLMVASYNGGINAVLKQFGKTREQAIARINRLKPEQVYRIIRYQFPRRETRLYLEKVVQRKARYQQWWQQNV
ncbi:Transglycosylase SLT domain-containing protein [Sulfurivirga caldicuralii]|uniref:Transglycosylase SLT domain-containing protein n=2 Tax=Sulfurivirga caldicuralii TaxID=364032 RepID=A0A1N6E654_9GAMM|nr:Transglycosylase SLT domain-containing protein [Sulfurivirga caldicuralii]